MGSSNDDGNILYLGGAIAVVAIGMCLVRAIGEFCRELAVAFHHFGVMMGSCVFMLWNTFEVVALLAMILGTAIGGVFFVARYFRAVREITENKAWLAGRLEDATQDLDLRFDAYRASIDYDMNALEKRLADALKKPEVVPEPVKEPPAPDAGTVAPAPAEVVPASQPF